MSEKSTKPSTVSNEAVIDELTKDLSSSLLTGDESHNVRNPSIVEDHIPMGSGDDGQASPLSSDDEYEKAINDKEEDDLDTDIDEVALKDAEIELSDDQKAERKIIAEELKNAGNEAYKLEDFERSLEKYTEGLRICPLQFATYRAILYCNRSAAKMKLDKHKRAVNDCSKAIELDDGYVKAYHRRAQCYVKLDKLDEALADFKKILELDPTHKEAAREIVRLPPLIEERNEKLKNEMLVKLKQLGNMVLKPFGLSTDNFKLEQDPETKGYKVNFKQ